MYGVFLQVYVGDDGKSKGLLLYYEAKLKAMCIALCKGQIQASCGRCILSFEGQNENGEQHVPYFQLHYKTPHKDKNTVPNYRMYILCKVCK